MIDSIFLFFRDSNYWETEPVSIGNIIIGAIVNILIFLVAKEMFSNKNNKDQN